MTPEMWLILAVAALVNALIWLSRRGAIQSEKAYSDARDDAKSFAATIAEQATLIAKQATQITTLTRDVFEVSERERACTLRSEKAEGLMALMRNEIDELRRDLSTGRGVPT